MNLTYLSISRAIVSRAEGLCSQSSLTILSINTPWRITAPHKSNANGEKFSQYRLIIFLTQFLDLGGILYRLLHLGGMEFMRQSRLESRNTPSTSDLTVSMVGSLWDLKIS